jgi:hypothetical protein
MGSHEEPESLLWKRLQDQMRYNDEKQRNRKRIIFMLSSLLIGISIGLLTLLANWPMGRDAKPVQSRSTIQQLESPMKSRKVNAQKKSNGTRDERIGQTTQVDVVIAPSVEKHVSEVSTQGSLVQDANRVKNNGRNAAPEMTNDAPSIENTANAVSQEAEQFEKSETETAEVINPAEVSNVGNQQKEINNEAVATEMEVRILPVKPDLGPMSSPNLSKFSLWMNLNPAYSYRTVADKSTITGPSTAHFNSAEQGKTNFNVGFGAAYAIRPMITVRSGVQWMSYRSVYTATNSSVPVDTASNRLGIESVYGTYYVSEKEFHHKFQEDPEEYEFNQEDSTSLCLTFTNEQAIRILQIPLTVEFGIQQGKMRYLAGAGLIYGLVSKSSANLSVEGFHPILSNNANMFTRSTMSGAIHFGVEYALTSKLLFRATPSFSYMLTKMNQSSNRSTHGFWGGLDLGLRFGL